MERSSTYRELRGIDSWSACKIVKYGSMKEDCHRGAKRIKDLIQVLSMDFEIVWQSRETEEIRFDYRISKDFDFGDYRISGKDFD